MKKHQTPAKLGLTGALFLWITVLVMQHAGSMTAVFLAAAPATLGFAFMIWATVVLVRGERAAKLANTAVPADI